MAEYNSWRICGERMEKTFMDMIMLGTGNAMVTNCYNTCFVLRDEKGYFMVDAGGGNTVLHQLEQAGIDWQDIHTMFVTHKHIDHLLGVEKE